MRVIGYMRVSTEEQGDSRAGLEAQESAIRAEAAHRGWDLVDLRQDIASGKSMRKRDKLGETLRDLAAGQADAPVVAKLDRHPRYVLDFAGIPDTAEREFFLGLPTSLALPAETIDRLRAIGGTLLRASPQFQQFLRAVQGLPIS